MVPFVPRPQRVLNPAARGRDRGRCVLVGPTSCEARFATWCVSPCFHNTLTRVCTELEFLRGKAQGWDVERLSSRYLPPPIPPSTNQVLHLLAVLGGILASENGISCRKDAPRPPISARIPLLLPPSS